MHALVTYTDRMTGFLSAPLIRGLALLSCRIALAGVFWRAGRTKIVDGSWLSISDSTRFLFQYEYSNVPLPTELAPYLATYAEHLFPALLAVGLATRFSALALLAMTLTIQVFVYPDAWWSVHSLWVALSLVLVADGPGTLSLDAVLWRRVTGRARS